MDHEDPVAAEADETDKADEAMRSASRTIRIVRSFLFMNPDRRGLWHKCAEALPLAKAPNMNEPSLTPPTQVGLHKSVFSDVSGSAA